MDGQKCFYACQKTRKTFEEEKVIIMSLVESHLHLVLPALHVTVVLLLTV
jgi:hypothetical protein